MPELKLDGVMSDAVIPLLAQLEVQKQKGLNIDPLKKKIQELLGVSLSTREKPNNAKYRGILAPYHGQEGGCGMYNI